MYNDDIDKKVTSIFEKPCASWSISDIEFIKNYCIDLRAYITELKRQRNYLLDEKNNRERICK